MSDQHDHRESPAQLPFFVYGTLRHGQENYRRFLIGKTIAEIPATMEGARLYALRFFPMVVEIEPDDMRGAENIQVQVVHGELITLHPRVYPSLLRMLDQLEGYNPVTDSGMFRRVKRNMKTREGESVCAWVYIGSEETLTLRPHTHLPEGDWCLYAEYARRNRGL